MRVSNQRNTRLSTASSKATTSDRRPAGRRSSAEELSPGHFWVTHARDDAAEVRAVEPAPSHCCRNWQKGWRLRLLPADQNTRTPADSLLRRSHSLTRVHGPVTERSMRSEDPQTIYLKDYAPSAYRIERVELDVDIAPDTSRVRALLTISPREGTAPGYAAGPRRRRARTSSRSRSTARRWCRAPSRRRRTR